MHSGPRISISRDPSRRTSCENAFPASQPLWSNQAPRSATTLWSRGTGELSPDGNLEPWRLHSSSSHSFFEAFHSIYHSFYKSCFSPVLVMHLSFRSDTISFYPRTHTYYYFIWRLLVLCIRGFRNYLTYSMHLTSLSCRLRVSGIYTLNK